MNKFIVIKRQMLCGHPDFGGYSNKLSYYLKSLQFVKYKKFYDLYEFKIDGVYECKNDAKLYIFMMKYPEYIFCILDNIKMFLVKTNVILMIQDDLRLDTYKEAIDTEIYKNKGFTESFYYDGSPKIAIVTDEDKFKEFIKRYPQLIKEYI